MMRMEQFISEIESYCVTAGINAPRLLRKAINAEWQRWGRWKSGASTPTMATVDRLRAYMAAHEPAPSSDEAV